MTAQPLITGESSPFFVTLPIYHATLNLAAIVLVDWSEEAVPEELAQAGYIATVHLANRTTIYIGTDDALILQDALDNYNQTLGRDVRNRVTFQQPTSTAANARQSQPKAAVAANGGSNSAGRK